jgi:hypothetical protein
MLQAGNHRPTEVTAYGGQHVSSDLPEHFSERYRAAYALEMAHFFDVVQRGVARAPRWKMASRRWSWPMPLPAPGRKTV